MSECQGLIRECQIYKTYAIMLGIAIGFFIFSFRFEKPIQILTWMGLIVIIAILSTIMFGKFESIYEDYPGLDEMKSAKWWWIVYVLVGSSVLYISPQPHIPLPAKCIVIGAYFTFVSQHPMRKIDRYIKQLRR